MDAGGVRGVGLFRYIVWWWWHGYTQGDGQRKSDVLFIIINIYRFDSHLKSSKNLGCLTRLSLCDILLSKIVLSALPV